MKRITFLFSPVFVNEEGNEVADKAVEVALTYLKKNSRLGVNVDLKRVVGNRTESTIFLEACKWHAVMVNKSILSLSSKFIRKYGNVHSHFSMRNLQPNVG